MFVFYLNLLPGKIHNPFHFVRDFYFFKRSQYPQLCLVHKKPEEAAQERQVSGVIILWPVQGYLHSAPKGALLVCLR